jgi:hypothetical protein
MLWLVRLQVAYATALLTTGAADHLMKQLKRALGRARITIPQAEISIDNADEIKFWKVVAFGHQLRTDNEIEAPFRDIVELLAQAIDRFDEIAREHQDASLRKKFGGLLLQPFNAGTHCGKALGSVTIRAFGRRRHGKSAVMADQPALKTVIHQPRIAIRTLQTETAGPTQRQRCVTTAIEKQ